MLPNNIIDMFFPICLCTFTMWTPTFILLNELCQSIGFTYWVNFLWNIYDQKNSCTLFYEDSNHIGNKSLHYISCTSVNNFFNIQFLISFDTISEFKTFVKSIELIKSWPSWLDLLWNCYQLGKSIKFIEMISYWAISFYLFQDCWWIYRPNLAINSNRSPFNRPTNSFGFIAAI